MLPLVIPVKTGIQEDLVFLDSRFRGNDVIIFLEKIIRVDRMR